MTISEYLELAGLTVDDDYSKILNRVCHVDPEFNPLAKLRFYGPCQATGNEQEPMVIDYCDGDTKVFLDFDSTDLIIVEKDGHHRRFNWN